MRCVVCGNSEQPSLLCSNKCTREFNKNKGLYVNFDGLIEEEKLNEDMEKF